MPAIHSLRLRRLTAATFLAALLATPALATDNERVSGFQSRCTAIVGATVHVCPGEVLKSATVVVREGLIVAVGTDVTPPVDAEIIDGAGLIVYAGFLDAGTSELLDPDYKVTPATGRTTDFARSVLAAMPPDQRNGLTPEFLATAAIKPKDETLEAARQSGVTAIHVLPTGRLASGKGALISLSGAPQREALVSPATMQSMQLVALGGGTYPGTLMGAMAHLRQAFLDADHARLHAHLFHKGTPGVPRPAVDAGWEALQELRDGKRRSAFLVSSRDDVHRALDFAAEHKLQPLLWGGRDLHLAVDRIAGKDAKPVDVLLMLDFGDEPKIEPPAPNNPFVADVKDPAAVQQHRRDEWTRRAATAAELHRHNVRFGFSARGLKNRNEFLKSVRQAIKSGLPADAALAALTTQPAAILEQGDRLGVVATGRMAHLVVMTAPLENDQARIRHVLIDDRRFEYNKDAKPVAPTIAKAAAPSLTGKWRLDIASADGRIAAELSLSQDGERLTGAFTSEQGSGRVVSGGFRDQKIEFVVGIGAGDRNVELKFQGTLSEGKLAGDLKPAFGAVTKWSAERVADPAKNPVAISLAPANASANGSANGPAEAEIPQTAPAAKPPATAELPAAKPQGPPVELPSDRTRRPIPTGGDVFISKGTVLTGTGETLPDTSILVRNGKIAAIGPNLEPEAGIAVIDAAGRFVMPGIIDTHSHIMVTSGINESTQSIVCEVRMRDVINSDDVSEYRALAGGVTAARILHGSANVIGGQDAVVKLKHGRTAAEHILWNAPQGVKFALGENVKFQSNRFPNTRLGVEATLNRAFFEAIDYRRKWMEQRKLTAKGDGAADAPKANGSAATTAGDPVNLSSNPQSEIRNPQSPVPPRRDLRLEALADIINHEKFIHSHCYRSDEILMLLNVASNHGIRVWSLQHVLEGYKVAPEIVAHGASCSTFADWWAYKVEAFDAIPFNAALLQEAGANVCIKSDDWELIRHLNQEGAKTVRYGNMDPSHALAAITKNPARELGLLDRMGTIEVGKDADLAIFSGHPFNAYSRCETTLVEGEVCFSREHSPSAILPEMAKASAVPPPINLVPPAERRPPLDSTPSTTGKYALVNATIHPVDAPDIPRGTVVIADGKIAAVHADNQHPSDARIIEAAGLHIYPGLIDAGTTVGLTEIGKVRETHDTSESGLFQPDLRAGIAINPDSELLPVARIGGITTALIRPTGGIVSGQASLMKLAGWTAPEMVLDYSAGLQVQWPSGGGESEKRVEQFVALLKDARLYDDLCCKADADSQIERPITDPRFEALRPYVRGEKPVFFEANSRKEIVEAVLFAEKHKLKCVITGAADAWKLADELKKRDIPLIVGPVMRAPVSEYDPFDAPYANPGRLHASGIRFCIRSNNASNSRNTPFEAAMAVAYGLPEAAALRAVTLSSAEILGIADRTGSITVGKSANLVIADGSPLQPTTQIKAIYIDGRPIPLESRQTKFYDRYRLRLNEVNASHPSQQTK